MGIDRQRLGGLLRIMAFTFTRLPACKWDLPNDRIDTYNRIRLIVDACSKRLTEPQIINLMEQYVKLGDDRIVHVIERWASRPTFSLDKLVDMLDGKEPLVFTQQQPVAPKPAAHTIVRAQPADEDIASNAMAREVLGEQLRKMRSGE